MSAERPITIRMSVSIEGYGPVLEVSSVFDPEDMDSVNASTLNLMRGVQEGMVGWSEGIAEWYLSEQ